jgi:cell division septation protein DedD
VVVFLLGVSVGRGVRADGPAGASAGDVSASGDTSVAAAMPPATQTTPNELDYHERLQGRGQPADQPKTDQAKPVEPPTPPGEAVAAPRANVAASDAPKGPVLPLKTPGSATAPATVPAAKPPAPGAAVSSSAAWSVQVMAFKSRDLADALVVKLKARGYSAFIFNSPTPGVPYHVRVGPFAQRDEAVRTVDRLAKEKEGYKTSVIR